METEKQANIVLIEWDGKKPPSVWYHRLKKLGLVISGNKDQSPLTRRQTFAGVAFQEGAILTVSESEARGLAWLAKDCGAKSVSIGKIEFSEMLMTNADAAVLNRIQQTLGKRGRPVKDVQDQDWTVTCLDEMKSFESFGREPVHCPSCGSFHIRLREGKRPVSFSNQDSKSLVKAWTDLRWSTGKFEEPQIDPVNGLELSADYVGGDDRDMIYRIEKSTLYQQISQSNISREKALRFLDIAFGVASVDPADRQHSRISAITRFIEIGGDQSKIKNLMVDPYDLDAFDLYWKDSSSLELIK